MQRARADLPANPVGGAAAEVGASGDGIEGRGRARRGGTDGVTRRAEDFAAEARLEEPFQFRQLLARELVDKHAEGGGGNREGSSHASRFARARRHVQLSPESLALPPHHTAAPLRPVEI